MVITEVDRGVDRLGLVSTSSMIYHDTVATGERDELNALAAVTNVMVWAKAR